ncbi:MAG TPA: PAS domain S-box protein [Gemmatimonadaceae bacterium]|nr:PAS domain S-box protein [Gemmatimonadaceae bacterium]
MPPHSSHSALDALPRERLSALIDQVPAIIVWLRGPEHVIEVANRVARALTGYRDIIGQPACVAMPELEEYGLISALDRVLETGEPFEARDMEFHVPASPGRSGEVRYLDFVYHAVAGPDGRPAGVLCHGIDVTAQALATKALREGESHHRQVLDSLPVVVYRAEATPPHETIYVNRAVESLGFTLEEWLARPDMWESRLHPDDRVRVRREARESLESARPMDSRYRMLAKDGSVRWFHDRGEFVPDRDGMLCVWQGIMLDITALQESEERERLLFEEAGIGMAVCHLDGRIERVNAALGDFLGYPASELTTLRYQDVMHPDDLPLDARDSERLMAGTIRSFTSERRYRRRDGVVVWGALTVALLRDAGGAPMRRLAQVQDITERRRAEQALAAAREALEESEARYRHIVANAPGMVYQYVFPPDGPGRYSFVSEGARTMFGVAPEDAVRDPAVLLDLIHPEDRPHFSDLAQQAKERAGAFRWEGRVKLRSEAIRFIQVVARDQRKADGTVLSDGLVVDVTESRLAVQRLRESEEQLRHTQKMEAVGRLAGGVAHDFNNLITIIRASAGFLLEDTSEADPRRDDVRQIAAAAERAASLTRQLLTFSRRQPATTQPLDLNEIVANLRPMLARVIGENILFSVTLHDRPAVVLGDVGQLEQALVNLAINARDAMPAGGRLGIDVSVVSLDPDAALGNASYGDAATPGRYARLSVWDNGSGMTHDVLARAFEPFFTTKDPGRGTGLGLSMVYGVVKQAGGHVHVESALGEGTVFELYLPLHDVTSDAPGVRADVARAAEGTETILLVEDEPGLRALARRILERQGYSVVASANGREALEAAAAHAAPLHLVLTDVVMPEMNGRAMVERLRGDRPEVAVVYMSGYSDDDAVLRGALESDASYIQKPFAPAELLRVVRETLDAATARR